MTGSLYGPNIAARIDRLTGRVDDIERRLRTRQTDLRAETRASGTGGTPSIFVAAADATARSRARADLVCTGTDDVATTIQEALDELAAGYGGRIVLSEGQFTGKAGDSLVIPYGVIVGGMEWQSTYLTIPTNAVGVEVGEGAALQNISVNKPGSTGITVELAGYAAAAERVWIEGSSSYDGIRCTSEMNHVIGCLARYCNTGIRAHIDSLIDGCIAVGNAFAGVEFGGGSERSIVTNSRVLGGGTATSTGIYVGGDEGNLVVANRVHATGRHGIHLNANGCVVVNNLVSGGSQQTHNSYDGIHITGNDNSVCENWVRHEGGAKQHRYGLNVFSGSANLVTNNDLKDAGATANFIDSGTSTVTTAGNRV